MTLTKVIEPVYDVSQCTKCVVCGVSKSQSDLDHDLLTSMWVQVTIKCNDNLGLLPSRLRCRHRTETRHDTDSATDLWCAPALE